jgi:antitoxin component of MazEF toxin-antitoxin module
MAEYPKFVTTCEETEDGDLAIPFPEELLEALGWTEGTTLDFDIIGDRLIIREVVAVDGEQNA